MTFFGGVFLPAVYLEITPNTHANTSCRFVLRSLRIAATPSFIAAHSLFSDQIGLLTMAKKVAALILPFVDTQLDAPDTQ